MTERNQNAFVLRIAPGGDDMVPNALRANQIMIGWGDARDLDNTQLTWPQMRDIVSRTFYAKERTLRKAGRTAGQLWRFIRDMQLDDLVIIPHSSEFYVATISGRARFDEATCLYVRPVEWLNDKRPIPRSTARAALQSRMKIFGTCANAGDLVEQIHDCLTVASDGVKPTFYGDLRKRLASEAINEIRTGRVESYAFEMLIRDLMLGLGATSCAITPRPVDHGADLVASFLLAGVFEVRIAIQAKHHYQLEPGLGANVVEDVIRGIEAENANLGMIVTAGKISDEAVRAAQNYLDSSGIKIELVDGEQFAQLIVERGLSVYRRD